MAEIKLVIFDCDGVLVDSEILANREAARVKTELGFPISTEEHVEKFVGLGKNSPVLQAELARLPDTYWELMRIARTEAFEKELKEISGVRKVVSELTIPFCMASSGAMEKIEISMRVTALGGLFTKNLIFNSEMVEHGKPAPDLFLHAADSLGVSTKNCLVVEDSPSGIEGALAAGMKAVAFTGGQHMTDRLRGRLREAGAHMMISEMKELPGCLV